MSWADIISGLSEWAFSPWNNTIRSLADILVCCSALCINEPRPTSAWILAAAGALKDSILVVIQCSCSSGLTPLSFPFLRRFTLENSVRSRSHWSADIVQHFSTLGTFGGQRKTSAPIFFVLSFCNATHVLRNSGTGKSYLSSLQKVTAFGEGTRTWHGQCDNLLAREPVLNNLLRFKCPGREWLWSPQNHWWTSIAPLNAHKTLRSVQAAFYSMIVTNVRVPRERAMSFKLHLALVFRSSKNCCS